METQQICIHTKKEYTHCIYFEFTAMNTEQKLEQILMVLNSFIEKQEAFNAKQEAFNARQE